MISLEMPKKKNLKEKKAQIFEIEALKFRITHRLKK